MFLDKIVESTKLRVEQGKKLRSFAQVRQDALMESRDAVFSFRRAVSQQGMSFICEVKKASPSKGVIAEEFPYLEIAKEYELAGASAISVLTEPEFFLGSPEYLTEIRQTVNVPLLRKDFIIDPYQIYEAKLIGASAILLISEILEETQLSEYLQTAGELGLSVLTECHSRPCLEKALRAGADIIGINNRNLVTFEVDIETCIRLSAEVPDGCLKVAESGIRTPQEVGRVAAAGIDAVLIGETLMRSTDKKGELERLKRGLQ